MTETIEAPAASSRSRTGSAGARSPATSGPQRPRLQPGDRAARPARSTSRPSRRSTRRSRPRRRRSPPGARCRSRSAPSSSSASASSSHARREEVAKLLDRRARQGALRRARRGDARARGDRVLLRHPDAAEGRVLRAGVDRDRRLLDPAAARRRRRDHAVQLPGDGARCGCGRRRSRAATRSCSSRRRRIRRRRSGRPSC